MNSSTIILKNKSKTDIRLYSFCFPVMPKPIKAFLEIRVSAGEEKRQPIPIVNNSDTNWPIRVNTKYLIKKYFKFFSLYY